MPDSPAVQTGFETDDAIAMPISIRFYHVNLFLKFVTLTAGLLVVAALYTYRYTRVDNRAGFVGGLGV